MLKLASSLGFALALSELKQRIQRMVAQGVLAAIGGVIFLIGLCFLLVAAHLLLSLYLPAAASAAIIGGVLVLIALIVFLIARQKGKAGTTPSSFAAASPQAGAAQDGMARLAQIFSSPTTATPALAVAGLALVLGYLFGRRSRSDEAE